MSRTNSLVSFTLFYDIGRNLGHADLLAPEAND
jgi:hypothetical protein